MPGRELDFEKLAHAIGVEDVRMVDPYEMEETEQALREAMDNPEPSVVITRRACVLEARERRPAPELDVETCIHCGQCIRIGCPALFDASAEDEPALPEIDTALCTGCTMCVQTCPVDALVVPSTEEGAE
jgi:indolepyruvate ferredoxin oxidoreductase alpha subunit